MHKRTYWLFCLSLAVLTSCGQDLPPTLTEAGTGAPQNEAALLSGVQGQVTERTCGGVRPIGQDGGPGAPNCVEVGKADKVTVTDALTQTVQTAATDNEGNFKLALPAGTYTVWLADSTVCVQSFMVCPNPVVVEVKDGAYVAASLQYMMLAP